MATMSRFFPCPYCKGKGLVHQDTSSAKNGDPDEYCGACSGSGDGRDYVTRKNTADMARIEISELPFGH